MNGCSWRVSKREGMAPLKQLYYLHSVEFRRLEKKCPIQEMISSCSDVQPRYALEQYLFLFVLQRVDYTGPMIPLPAIFLWIVIWY